MAQAIEPKLGGFESVGGLISVCSSFAEFGYKEETFITALAEAIKPKLGDFDFVGGLISVCSSFAEFGYKEETFITALAEAIKPKLSKALPREMRKIVDIFESLSFPSHGLMEAIVNELVRRANSGETAIMTELLGILDKDQISKIVLSEGITVDIFIHPLNQKVKEGQYESDSTGLYELAYLNIKQDKIDREVFSAIAMGLKGKVDELDNFARSNLAWTFAKAKLATKFDGAELSEIINLYKEIESEMLKKPSALSLHDIGITGWSFNEMAYYAGEFFPTLADEIVHRQENKELMDENNLDRAYRCKTMRSLANIAFEFSGQTVLSEGQLESLFKVISDILLKNIEHINDFDLCQFIAAFERVNFRPPSALFQKVAVDFDQWLRDIVENEFYQSNPHTLLPLSRFLIRALDVQPDAILAQAREAFTQLHVIAINYHLTLYKKGKKGDFGEGKTIPQLLAALQGRKFSGLLLDKDLNDADVERLAFNEVRRQLREAILKKEDHPALWAQYADLREQLEEKGLLANVEQILRLPFDDLQQTLPEKAAILFIIQVPAIAATEENVFALIIGKYWWRIVEITDWNRLDVALKQYADSLKLVRHRMREGPGMEYDTSTGETIGFEAFNAILQETFWEELSPHLTEHKNSITELRVITQGCMHTVPYEIALPDTVVLRHFPGLVFYCQHYGVGMNPKDPVSGYKPDDNKIVCYAGYDAEDHPGYDPIPMVNAEIAMPALVWGNAACQPITNLQTIEPSAMMLCLSGHGSNTDAKTSSDYGIVLGKDQLLTFADVLNMPYCPPIVFLSACVVGRIREDQDGDPMGLVSAFLLRGAQYVVAPLQPVDDFYIPLLSCLFQQSLKRKKQPDLALLDAKRRLKEGDWFYDTEDIIRKMYSSAIEQWLGDDRDDCDYETLCKGWPGLEGYHGHWVRLGREPCVELVVGYLIAHRRDLYQELSVEQLLISVRGYGGLVSDFI